MEMHRGKISGAATLARHSGAAGAGSRDDYEAVGAGGARRKGTCRWNDEGEWESLNPEKGEVRSRERAAGARAKKIADRPRRRANRTERKRVGSSRRWRISRRNRVRNLAWSRDPRARKHEARGPQRAERREEKRNAIVKRNRRGGGARGRKIPGGKGPGGLGRPRGPGLPRGCRGGAAGVSRGWQGGRERSAAADYRPHPARRLRPCRCLSYGGSRRPSCRRDTVTVTRAAALLSKQRRHERCSARTEEEFVTRQLSRIPVHPARFESSGILARVKGEPTLDVCTHTPRLAPHPLTRRTLGRREATRLIRQEQTSKGDRSSILRHPTRAEACQLREQPKVRSSLA
ncbi:hypothetical protein KM043_000439 [Ampulex compressa]|nr:hypothetical protein KM043_000439 [Ampulex compressa]